jgi:hypothetical protein
MGRNPNLAGRKSNLAGLQATRSKCPVRLAVSARQTASSTKAESDPHPEADAGDSWGGASDGLKLRTGQDRQPVKRSKGFHVGVTGKRRGPKRKRR